MAFVFAGALAVAVALAFLLLPLVRGGGPRRAIEKRLAALDALREDLDPGQWQQRHAALSAELEQAPRASIPWKLVAALVILVPGLVLGLYRVVGTPDGLTPPEGQTAEIRDMLRDLAARVHRDPDDARAWASMGLIWKDLQQFPAAEAALRRVLFIEPHNPMAQVELAETLLFASGRPNLPDESRTLLESALATDPANQKAMWLAGIGAFQSGDYTGALAYWERLEEQLPDGSVRDQVHRQIERARMQQADPGLAGGRRAPVLPPDHPPVRDGGRAGESAPADTAGAIDIALSIGAELAGELDGSETVFVFARAAAGGGPPLAIRRLRAADLPTTVRLSDGDAMMDGLRLSSFAELQIVARVSMSGSAEARPGDFQATLGPVAAAEQPRVEMVIDRVVQ